MPTQDYDHIRKEGSDRRPRFFEELSSDEQEAFSRSFRRASHLIVRVQKLRQIETKQPFLRALRGILLDRSIVTMLAVNIFGIVIFRLLGGTSDRGRDLLNITFALLSFALVARIGRRLPFIEALRYFE